MTQERELTHGEIINIIKGIMQGLYGDPDYQWTLDDMVNALAVIKEVVGE